MLERALSLHVVQPPCLSLHEAARLEIFVEISTSLLGLFVLVCSTSSYHVDGYSVLAKGESKIRGGRSGAEGREKERKKERKE